VRHIMAIRSAYTEESISQWRMMVSRDWLIPSLQAQTQKPELVVGLSEDDPFIEERKQMFCDAGCSVRFVIRDRGYDPGAWETIDRGFPWGFEGGDLSLISRCDDDDAIPTDFAEVTAGCAERCGFDRAVLDWPIGYTAFAGKMYHLYNRSNQFISILSTDGLSPYEVSHRTFEKHMPRVIVSDKAGWTWVRHGKTVSGTRRRYRMQLAGRSDSSRWAVQAIKDWGG